MTDPRAALAHMARPLVLIAMPVLGVVNQYCAEQTANAMLGRAFGIGWLEHALTVPWVWAWIAFEVVTLAAWTVVLSELSLSAAFPMTALGYAFVIALGWTAFHEPITPLQVVGAAAILVGVWLLGDEAKPEPEPPPKPF
jgi:drug/metabolite transporter (DMT)-like permease